MTGTWSSCFNSCNFTLSKCWLGAIFFRKRLWSNWSCTFFLLSGYLMSKLYLDQPCSFSILKNYLLRRIARILPLYLSALILSALLLYTFDLNIYQNANYRYIAQSIAMIRGFNVFWTVPVEFHFYVIFMGIWVSVTHYNTLVFLIGVVIAQLFILFLLGPHVNGLNWIFYWLHIFLLGICISQLQSLRSRAGKKNIPDNPTTLRILLGILLVGMILLPPEIRVLLGIPTWGRHVDPFVLTILVVFLWLAVQEVSFLKFLKCRLIRSLGLISYSIYICLLYTSPSPRD